MWARFEVTDFGQLTPGALERCSQARFCIQRTKREAGVPVRSVKREEVCLTTNQQRRQGQRCWPSQNGCQMRACPLLSLASAAWGFSDSLAIKAVSRSGLV